MRHNYRKELDKEWERAPFARRIDVNAMYDLLQKARRQDAVESIERERRKRKQHHIYDDLPDHRYRPQAGRQDITMIPTDQPLEQLVLDQLGVAKEYGKPWICPKCHVKFQMAFPPPICPVCRNPSFIETGELSLRR
jgi:rubrerythrin